MKTLYFDCGMGAAGDMLSAALLELFDDKQAVLGELNALGIPGVEFKAEVSTKCGINGTHLSVTVNMNMNMNMNMSMNTTTGITTTAAWRISSISSGICRWRMRCVQT